MRVGGVDRVMRLDVEEVVAVAQNVGNVNDAGAFLVPRQEIRIAGDARVEELAVMLAQLQHGAALRIKDPNLADVSLVADILKLDEPAGGVHGEVIEHLARIVRAVDHDLDLAAELGKGNVVQGQAPEPILARGAELVRGVEVDDIRMPGIPGAVFWPPELSDLVGQ